MNYITISKFAITMLILDYVYLSTVSSNYNDLLLKIQNKPLKLKPIYALVVYIIMTVGWTLLILLKNKKYSLSNNVINSIILGIVIYGVFDFTNLAIFNNYSLTIALIDVLWGGVLFGISSYVALR
jgi:uncharacterized membrane protein